MHRLSVLSTIFTVLLVLALPLTVFLTLQRQDIRQRAQASGPVRGQAGDLWADIVLGQFDFHQATANEVVPFKVFNPGGALVDRSVQPNRVYVYDGANSRVLGYSSLGQCVNDTTRTCTSNADCPGSTCSITTPVSADLVLGQPSGYGYSACNGDGNMENYPYRKPASASTLCSTPETQNSPGEGGSFASMALDAQGNVYIADFFNSRVLKYTNPFTTDTIADEVWGQDDFTGNRCNKIDGDLANNPIPQPTASSLCMGRNTKYQESFTAGVDIDSVGNLWVADSSNHRVLRFPNNNGQIAKTADLVLGQPNFTSRNRASGLNQMSEPATVRVNSQGWVYVADAGNNRILLFKTPVSNGMSGEVFLSSTQVHSPKGIEFDPQGQGIWINDSGNNMVELWTEDGTTVQKVLFKDTYQPNGQCGSATPGAVCSKLAPNGECWANMCDTRGSLGIDSDGTVIVAGSSFNQDVHRYTAPIPTPQSGIVYAPEQRLAYPPNGSNLRSNKGLYSPRSVVVENNQLIVSDGSKVVFWNDLASLINGKPADGIVAATVLPSSDPFQYIDPWGIGRIAADNQNRLWVLRKSTVDVYQLPLIHKATPIKTAISFERALPVLGGGQISWGFDDDIQDVNFDQNGNLWFSQATENPPLHRVVRVRNPFTSPLVDVILGQPNYTGTYCNRTPGVDYTKQTPNTVCFPGSVTVDRQGNVWVSDHRLEFVGNNRLLEFNASLFQNITTTALFGPNASLVSPYVQAWKPAFDSQNHMVVGYNGQTQPPGFPGLYVNPLVSLLSTALPDAYLKDYFSHGYSATFDGNDNLYITDFNRGRVLIYKTPFGVVTPTPLPPTPTSTPAPTIVPTPTPIPSWCTACGADINRDGVVNGADSSRISACYGKTSSQFDSNGNSCSASDINGDGVVNDTDTSCIQARFLQSCVDTTPPTVSITSPLNNTTVAKGTTVVIQANASDNRAVAKVEFFVGTTLLCSDTTSPYNCSWSVPKKANVKYNLKATAYDKANNSSSSSVSVTAR